LTGRDHYLRGTVPAGPRADREAKKVRTRLLAEVDERRNPRTNATVGQLLDRHLEMAELDQSTLDTYRGYVKKHIRPLLGSKKVGQLDADVLDSFTPSCDVAAIIAQAAMRLFIAPGSHTAVTNAASLIPAGHFQRLLSDRSTSFSAVRCVVQSAGSGSRRTRWPRPTRPRHPSRVRSHRPPRRQPASSARRGKTRILVWLTMVTGLRRGELCAIKWRHVNLPNGVLSLERSVSQRGSRTWERERERERERDTKTHQQRRITLDHETVRLLVEHRTRCEARAAALGIELSEHAFVFSLAPDGSTHLRPDSVTSRYRQFARRLEIKTSIHKLRHYSATELIAAGVDVRTVAGRLGHGGGGTTMLRVYTAWMSESDQRAAGNIAFRMPALPSRHVDEPSSSNRPARTSTSLSS
jgi:integrase